MGPLAGRIPSLCTIRYLRQLVFPSVTKSTTSTCCSNSTRQKTFRLRHCRRYHATGNRFSSDERISDPVPTTVTSNPNSEPMSPSPQITAPRTPGSSPRTSHPPTIKRGFTPEDWKEEFNYTQTAQEFKRGFIIWRDALGRHADTDWELLLKMANRLMTNLNENGHFSLCRAVFGRLEGTKRALTDDILTEYLCALRRRNPTTQPNSYIALRKVNSMLKRGTKLSTVTFSALLRIMVDEGRMELVTTRIKEWEKSNYISSSGLISVLKGWTRLRNVERIEALREWMVKVNLVPGKRFLEALLESYFILGRPSDAHKVFKDMAANKQYPERRTYEKLIFGYTKISDWKSVLAVFKMMEEQGIYMSIGLFNGLLQILAEKQNYRACYEFYTLAIAQGIQLNAKSYNMLIKACLWAKNFRNASGFLRDMRTESVNADSWTVDQLMRVGELEHVRFRSLRSVYGALKSSNPNLLSMRSRNALLTNRLASRKRPLSPQFLNQLHLNRMSARTLMMFYLREKQYEAALSIFRRLLNTTITPTPPLFALALRAAFSLRHEHPDYPTALQLIQTARDLDVPLTNEFINAARNAATPNRRPDSLPPSEIHKLLTLANRALEVSSFPQAFRIIRLVLDRDDLNPSAQLVARTILIKGHILLKNLEAITHVVEDIIANKHKVDRQFLATLKGTGAKVWAKQERSHLANRVKGAGDERRVMLEGVLEDWTAELTKKSPSETLQRPLRDGAVLKPRKKLGVLGEGMPRVLRQRETYVLPHRSQLVNIRDILLKGKLEEEGGEGGKGES